MEAVTGDPPFNSVPHELEIDDGLAGFRMLEEVRRGALRTDAGRAHSTMFYWGTDTGGRRFSNPTSRWFPWDFTYIRSRW